MMKTLFKKMTLLSILVNIVIVGNAYSADELKAKTLMYISPLEYNHSVQLLTPYHDGYWFEQGPLVEPVAFAALKTLESDLAMCNGGETADTIIKIKPYLFYNPWPGAYYSTLVATVYAADGESLGVYTGKGKHVAPGPALLRITVPSNISKAYELAMEDVMSKLKIMPIAERKKVVTVLPCGIIGSQLEPRFNIN
jgi:hypothetical protein